MSVGVPVPIAGTITGGANEVATQLHENGGNWEQVDLLDVGYSTTSGVVLGVAGEKISGIMGIPDIPRNALHSMDSALIKRIVNAVKYQMGKGATQEISNAIAYYFSQTATEIWRTIIKTLLIENVRDTAIEQIIESTGLENRAKKSIRNTLGGMRGRERQSA